MSTQPLPESIHNLLAAVLEALDIPNPATVGGTPAHDRVLNSRVIHAKIALRDILTEGAPLGIEWTTRYLRERLADNQPTGYVTFDQAAAARAEGKTWSEAIAPEAGEGQ